MKYIRPVKYLCDMSIVQIIEETRDVKDFWGMKELSRV